jgi:DNA polymerase III delta prime subunit
LGRTSFMGRQAVLDKLQAIAAADKLGQPFLLVGPQGCGKENTALEFSRLLNCVGGDSCSSSHLCESCVKALSFQHPDLRWICPSPASVDEAQIVRLFENKVKNPFFMPGFAATSFVRIGDPEKPGELTIRSLIHFLRRRAFQGRYKVAIVADSHRFNPAAANAFLKTLEEPSPDTVIFLLTTSTDGMLPTILSRCQKIAFKPWTDEEMTQILIQEGGADAQRAVQVGRMAEGNARQALAMLDPTVLGLVEWSGLIFDWINTGQRGLAAISADEIHRGVYSHALDISAPKKGRNDNEKDSLADSRGRAIRLCELLVLHYSDAVACREMGADWKPRLPLSKSVVARAAAHRRTDTLLEDMARIETTRREIDRNINIGISIAVLFEGLIDHVERDKSA